MESLNSSDSSHIILSKEQYVEINNILAIVQDQTRCIAILVADTSGLLIAKRGGIGEQVVSLLASLVAGNFAATKEMARLVGEQGDFKVHFHEGIANNIYIHGLNQDFFVAVVYGRNTAYGLIRTECNKLGEQLGPILKNLHGRYQDLAHALNIDKEGFEDELSARLDSVLNNKD